MLRRAPEQYRSAVKREKKRKLGRAAFDLHRSFTGVPLPPSIRYIRAHGKPETVVGMGYADQVVYHNGAKKSVKGDWFGVTDAKGRRIVLLNRRNMRRGLPKKYRLRYLGRMMETHYEIPDDVKNAGSPKSGTHWAHKHHDQGGKWPEGYVDQNGNIWYAPGTYRVRRWIRR